MSVFDSIFPGQSPGSGADEGEINRFLADLRRPVSAGELDDLREAWQKMRIAPLDAKTWRFPERSLPAAYLEFLRWSNGGAAGFTNGQREFGFLTTRNLREYMVAYEFPEYMPDALPFAMNGGGWFYVFDMRQDPRDGEYPVLFTHSGELSYDEAYPLGDSFVAVLRDARNPEELARPSEDPPYPLRGKIWLVCAPPGGMSGMFRLKKSLAASWGAMEMKRMVTSLPRIIIEDGYPYAVSRKLQHERDLLSVLGYSAEGSDRMQRYSNGARSGGPDAGTT